MTETVEVSRDGVKSPAPFSAEATGDVTNIALATQLTVIKLTLDEQISDLTIRPIAPRTQPAERKAKKSEALASIDNISPSGGKSSGGGGLLSFFGFGQNSKDASSSR